MSSWLLNAVRKNDERRQVRFVEGQRQGMRWMLECRDMWDASDDDGGVYFSLCASESDVTAIAQHLNGTNTEDRLLGIYDLSKPLIPQGAGISRSEWLVHHNSQIQSDPRKTGG
jgi:hypothetical protein